MQTLAYGPLELKPAELGVLTPADLAQLLDGYRWRRRALLTDQAWATAALLNAHKDIVAALTGKRQRYVKASDLLPKEFAHDDGLTVEKVQQELQEKVQRFAANAKKAKKEIR